MLVLIGADAGGKKELLAIDDGFRESEQSWHELLVRLRDENGLVIAPELATGDGALGFWKAAKKVWPAVQAQRCWVHKTANVLNYLPKSVQNKAKTDLHAIYEAASRADAEAAFDRFLAKYQAKYDKAAHCLAKDRGALLAFYAFPPSTGSTSEAPIRSRAPSRPCGFGPTRPKAVSRARPRSPWSSNSPGRPSATGAG